MKSYHNQSSRQAALDKPGTPPSAQTAPPTFSAPLADPSAVSRGGLLLFRLIERLARRRGYAHVRIAPSELRPGKSLSEMLGKCARHVRRLLSELLALGWVSRQCDGRMVYLKPLVCLAEAPKTPRVPAPKGAFFAGKMSGLMSGLKAKNVRSRHLRHITDTDKGDNKQNETLSAGESPAPCPVAVSLLSSLVTPHEALELAREASRQKLTEDQIRRVIEAYKGQLANIRNRGAWLREALRRGFAPAAPLSTHASDQGGLPVARVVKIAKDQPFWTGQVSRGTGSSLRGKPPVASPATQPAPVASGRGIGHLKATIEALKARTA